MARYQAAAVRIAPVEEAAMADLLPALADLRIEVFRAYPYLYDGDRDYEAWYLSEFARAPGAVVVGAFHGATLVGAATGAPMAGQKADWAAPFAARGDDLDTLFYCGESVLRAAYRGLGIGHAFFDVREARARALGATRSAFAAIVRPPDDPRRPADYRPLDPFWRGRGYAPVPGLTTRFSRKEVGAAEESEHVLQYWMRTL